MNHSIISTRYAKALIKAGSDNGCLDALEVDMTLLDSLTRGNAVFRQVLDAPVIKPMQKRRMMAELLDGRVHPLTLNFINLVIRNRRESLLADVARDFIDLYEKRNGIQRVHVVSAAGMDDLSEQHLQQQLNALFRANVHLTAETNAALIGGFILRVGDLQYDASLASGLTRLQKTLSE